MKKVYIWIWLLIIIDIICYIAWRNWTLSSIGFLLGMLAIAWYFKLPQREWLLCRGILQKKEKLGSMTTRAAFQNRIPVHISGMERFTLLEDYFICKKCIRDTDELIEEIHKFIIFALIIYAVIFIENLITSQLNFKMEGPALESFKMYRNIFSLVYLGLTSTYLAWMISPALIQRKKNTIACSD